MSSNSFGTLLRVTTFGESHGPALGAVLDGVPAGLELTEQAIQRDLERRRPGTSPLHSPRQEPDRVRIVAGLFDHRTTGAPVALLIDNCDSRPDDYEALKDTYRPGHADFSWEKKYGRRDHRGGGRASGRETVARVAAGAIARVWLAAQKIDVIGAVGELGGIKADLTAGDWHSCADDELRCPDAAASQRMREAIVDAQTAGDSVGGVVELRASGVPPGLGEPVFDKLDARLAAAMLSIGAVKGVEIGDGFALARVRGSESNDPLEPQGRFASNHAGGILGGVSSGQEVILRLAIKPTPSISKAQQTVDRSGTTRQLCLGGRHDPCLVPRVVAVAEAMACLVLADMLLLQQIRER